MDQVGHRFGLREIDAAVEKGAFGKLSGFGQARPALQNRLEDLLEKRGVTVRAETEVTAVRPLEGLYGALGEDRKGFCDACLSGEYLLEFPHRAPAATQLRIVGT